MTTFKIRRTYVDTALGQMHCRSAGEGAPVVMLHWGLAHNEPRFIASSPEVGQHRNQESIFQV